MSVSYEDISNYFSQLNSQAPIKPLDPTISLARYYNTILALFSQAQTYEKEEGKEEYSYIYYRRIMILQINSIKKHPDYGKKESDLEKKKYRKIYTIAMDRLEELRKNIEEKLLDNSSSNQSEGEEQQIDIAEQQSLYNQSKENSNSGDDHDTQKQDDDIRDRMNNLLLASESPTLTDLIPNVDAQTNNETNSNILNQESNTSFSKLPSYSSLSSASYLNGQPSTLIQPPSSYQSIPEPSAPTEYQIQSSNSDNTVNQQTIIGPSILPINNNWANLRLPTGTLNQPQPLLSSISSSSSPVPNSSGFSPYHGGVRASGYQSSSNISLNQSISQQRNLFNVNQMKVLRRVHLPLSVTSTFLTKYANNNTINNIETCGIIAGKLVNNELYITHIIIPAQNGTADTCVTHNEEELLLYQTSNDLLTLGWIHTHPTQSCFLSSVDLHTHYSYQLMLNEAIAIVCSPLIGSRGGKEEGIFVINDNGMEVLSRCTRGGFHKHESSGEELFVEANHVIKENLTIEFVDLRDRDRRRSIR